MPNSGKGHPRRQPSVKCTLRTKAAPRGHFVKDGSLTKNHENELKSALHKRALRTSNSPPNCDVIILRDLPDNRVSPPSSAIVRSQAIRLKVPEKLKSCEASKENKKKPPQVKPKPNVKSKTSQDELSMSLDTTDTNRTVKELKEQFRKLMSPVSQESPGLSNLVKRKSKGELSPTEIAEVINETSSNCNSSNFDSSANQPNEHGRRNSRPLSSNLTLAQDNCTPSPRTKTADIAAMFENKGQTPNMDQPKTAAALLSPRPLTPGQKPAVPNKPKSQVPKPQSDSIPSSQTPTSEEPKKPSSAKPAVPKKSLDSAKLAELRKSMSGLNLTVAKPSVPMKPPVALRPKVEKDQIKDHPGDMLLKSPQRMVSPLSDRLKSQSSSETEFSNLGLQGSSGASGEPNVANVSPTVSDSNNSCAAKPHECRLSNSSVGSTSSNTGSNTFEESISESSSSRSQTPIGRSLSNSSDGSSKIPAEFLHDTTNFSGASRFVSSPWKHSRDLMVSDHEIQTIENDNSKEVHDDAYGNIWSCTRALPLPPEPRNDYEEVDTEYEDISDMQNNEEDENEWKDCDSDKFDSNQLTVRPLRIRLVSAQEKSRSLRRNTLNPRRHNRASYDEVYLPGEEDSDSDGWMTESDGEDSDDYYEEIDSGGEDDLDRVKDPQGQPEVDQSEGQQQSHDPVAPPRRKSVEVKGVTGPEITAVSRSSEGELNGSSSSFESGSHVESRSGIRKSGVTPHGSPKTPMAALMGQLHLALKTANKEGKNSDRNSQVSDIGGKRSSSQTDLDSNSSSHPNSNSNSSDLPKMNQDSGRVTKNARLSLPHLRTSLSASPSSVSSSSVSSTCSTSSSSSLTTPVPTRPAPKPPLHLAKKSASQSNLSHQSDAEDGIPSSGYSSETDKPPSIGLRQSRDSSAAMTSQSMTSSTAKEAQETTALPPTLPPRKKRLSKPTIDTPKQNPDEPPALPPPRIRLPKPVNPQSVSTSKDAMFPRSKSPEKIFQGQTGQGEGQTIPDINSNVQSADDFVNSFITVNEDRREGFEDDFFSDNEEQQTKASRGSSVDSEGGNYLTLIDAEIPPETDGRSPFVNEPLYQIYHCGVVARNVWESSNEFPDEEDPDSFIETSTLGEGEIQSVCGTLERMAKGQNASETELHATLQTLARGSQNFRTLWCEMPEVQKLGVLETMSQKEKRFQESLFEIITSEASYLKSLSIFLAFFVDRPGIKGPSAVITEAERKELFSNIAMIKDVSKRFMNDLETRWKQDPMLSIDLCEIISDYAKGDFNAYVTYCANLIFQERKLRKLRETNERFQQLVVEFEARPECKSLPINTFLTLPMQRITRMPLLVDAVCQRTEPETPEYILTRKALVQLQKLVRTSNERARQIANIEQNTEIDRSLDFKKMKKMPIVSQSKSLVKKGKLTRIFRENKGFLGNKRKESLYLYLFNDLLIIAKKKNTNSSNETRAYQVVDYASRNAVEATVIDGSNLTKWLPIGVPSGCQNLFVLALVDNHEHKHTDFYFACESLSERMRWVEAVTPVSQVEDERIYEDWDCPQVQVIYRYVARQPDELTLEEADVINVSRKVADGWFEGERIRDGEQGWFPGNHTVEIQSPHIRAKNLKQRYRLLTISEHFLLDSSVSSNYSSKA